MLGGTGPSGPHIVEGLLERGFDVTMLHSGCHEVDFITDRVRHLHANAFEIAEVANAIGKDSFDLAIVTYGRLREIATLLRGRVGKFISVGAFAAYRGAVALDDDWPSGTHVPFRENSALASTSAGGGKLARILESENAVFDNHPLATHLRYANVYGPRHPVPVEWTIVRRAIDRRAHLILPGDGLTIRSRIFAVNAAHAVMCVLDRPSAAQGEIFNVADEWSPTLRQLIDVISKALKHQFNYVSMPYNFAAPAHPMFMVGDPGHRISAPDKAIHVLGYRDKIPVETAITQTTLWLERNPPSAEAIARLGDRFDYGQEDKLISAWQAATAAFDPVGGSEPAYVPRYAWSGDNRRAPSLSAASQDRECNERPTDNACLGSLKL